MRQPSAARRVLCCSISWPVAKLAALTAFAALEQSRRVRARSALTRAAMRSALLGAAYVAADAHPPPALPAPPCPAAWNTTSVAVRRAVPGVGDLWGGEKRSAGVGARGARASTSDSPRLSERNERSECSEFRGATPARASERSRHTVPIATVGAHPGYRPPRRALLKSSSRQIKPQHAPRCAPLRAAALPRRLACVRCRPGT